MGNAIAPTSKDCGGAETGTGAWLGLVRATRSKSRADSCSFAAIASWSCVDGGRGYEDKRGSEYCDDSVEEFERPVGLDWINKESVE